MQKIYLTYLSNYFSYKIAEIYQALSCFSKQTFKKLLFLLFLLFGPFFQPQVIALPAPMTKAQILEDRDIYARIKVLGVMRVSDIPYYNPKHQEQNHNPNNYAEVYQAWVQILEIYKGNYKPHDTIIVRWQIDKRGLIGGWYVGLEKDQEMAIYLKKYMDTGSNLYSEIAKEELNQLYYTATYYAAKEN